VLRFDPEHVGALYFQGVLLAAQHRFREAIGVWNRVMAIAPEGDYARRARRDVRTASDLERIFAKDAHGEPRTGPGRAALPRPSLPFGSAGPVTRPAAELPARANGGYPAPAPQAPATRAGSGR
jgi:hypothetical protein